jgi:hypothetical protein
MESPRPPIFLSLAMPVPLRLGSYFAGFVPGMLVALALGLEVLVALAVPAGFLVQLVAEVSWRQTHRPVEDGPYAFYTKERRLQKARQQRNA